MPKGERCSPRSRGFDKSGTGIFAMPLKTKSFKTEPSPFSNAGY
jgi:hypothetical protein